MRVYKKTVKDCENAKGEMEKVLSLKYSHNGEKGEVLVRNYDERLYKKIRATLEKELDELLETAKNKIEENFKKMEEEIKMKEDNLTE